MARQYFFLEDVAGAYLPYTVDQLRKRMRDKKNPLPYKKAGKRILLEKERIDRWYDSLPGQDLAE